MSLKRLNAYNIPTLIHTPHLLEVLLMREAGYNIINIEKESWLTLSLYRYVADFLSDFDSGHSYSLKFFQCYFIEVCGISFFSCLGRSEIGE